MTQKSELGTDGESFATEYLKGRGYKILERNKREKWGELDIIAMAPDKTLVFIEVKTMRPSEFMKPEDQMSAAKMRKFKRAAEFYAGAHEELIDDRKGWRLDLLALEKQGNLQFTVRHYENI